MKKRYILILLILLTTIFVGCGEIVVTPGGSDNPGLGDGDTDKDPDNDVDDDTPIDVTPEFSVILLDEGGRKYVPKATDEVINVIWDDGFSKHIEPINSEGVAKKRLDGDYNVYLDNCPENYTYNPNIYVASNSNYEIQIQLIKIYTIRRGEGNGKGLYTAYNVREQGTYQTTITSKTQKVYYEFFPTESGKYYIESLVNIYNDTVNPYVDVYTGSAAAKYFKESLDSGGVNKPGGYTTNFKWEVEIAEQELGGCFTFAIYAESKTGIYPLTVDFTISRFDDKFINSIPSSYMTANEIKGQTPDFSSTEYTYINCDGGTGNYFNLQFTNAISNINDCAYLIGDNYRYNEEDGYWHVLNPDGSFGPILCAKITQACAYFDPTTGPLSIIQAQGNTALTIVEYVYDGVDEYGNPMIKLDEEGNKVYNRENYTDFIEIQYADIANKDGVVFVTMELKNFLQKFSVSQRLFLDGGGFVEGYRVYATEEDQWLFACGYYIPTSN